MVEQVEISNISFKKVYKSTIKEPVEAVFYYTRVKISLGEPKGAGG